MILRPPSGGLFWVSLLRPLIRVFLEPPFYRLLTPSKKGVLERGIHSFVVVIEDLQYNKRHICHNN